MAQMSWKSVVCAITVLCVALRAAAVFPEPAQMTSGASILSVSSSSFTIQSKSQSKIVQGAISRYTKLLFPFPQDAAYSNPNVAALTTLTVTTSSIDEDLQLGVDESYSLSVTSTGNATLQSNTVWGALRGLETFSQLITFDYLTKAYTVQNVPISIKDAPRFQWRGLLIDSARHYLPVSTINRVIDTLSYNKMNVLHWHMVDAQSFPYVVPAFPELSAKGAYHPSAIYTSADVASIVAYGRDRGVRVIPEIDVPGHAYSWGAGYPNVTTKCPKYAANINNIPLNPSDEFMWEVLSGVFKQISKDFSDHYIHVGGDEVIENCWLQDDNVIAWMKIHDLKTGTDVYTYFENKIQNMITSLNRTAIVWNDLIDDGVSVPVDTIFQIWKNSEDTQKSINGGHRTLVSYPWYLDKQIPNVPNVHYEFEDTWHDMYAFDPIKNLTGKTELIIGGEACMWGEQVDTTTIDGRVWPRASGVAERLWSPASVTDLSSAINRLATFRCKSMAQRGINAGPITPDYCPLP